MSTAQQAHVSQKFRLDKATTGEVTLLTLHGVIGEGFEAKKVADAVRTHTVVLNLRNVRRFASWGMAEWMEFVRLCAQRDVYLVECSTQAVNQFTLVTGLMGPGKLVSFYVPYRCGNCGDESEVLLLVPLDRAAMRDLVDAEQVCRLCSGPARVDRYLATMCTSMAERPAFDINDDAVAYFRSQLKYNIAPDVNRFRAYRRSTKDHTYLRLSGNIDGLPAETLAKAVERTTVVDLAGINTRVFDADTLAGWRSFVQASMANVEQLQLLDCPPGFLDKGIAADDLQKVKVRTFALSYWCPTCRSTTNQMVDVAANLEHLVEGILPTSQCATCKTPVEALVDADLLGTIRRLPVREHDQVLDKFLAKARAEPAKELEDALIVRPAAPAKPPAPGVTRALYVASALLLLVAVGVAITVMTLWKRDDTQPAIVVDPTPVVQPKPTFQRPDWIVSDLPSSAFCHDLINRLMCVGVSTYRPSRNEAVADAKDAALDELVHAIGLKISSSFFREKVLPSYSQVRAKALSSLQAVELDRTTKDYAAAEAVVREARRRVVESFRLSGGAAVPAQQTDWYWEAYALDKGSAHESEAGSAAGPTEVLVFVRYDVPIDAVKALVEKYSTPTSVLGATVLTAFPALGWTHTDYSGGAMIVTAGRALAKSGIAPTHVVTAVEDQRVPDAASFATRLQESSGKVSLTVKAGDEPTKVVEVRR
jgi:hypothetical protein